MIGFCSFATSSLLVSIHKNKATLYPTMEWMWIVYFLFLSLLLVMYVLLIIFYFTRSHKVTAHQIPSLEDLYVGGTASNNLEVTTGVKAFRVQSDTKVQPLEDAVRFGLSFFTDVQNFANNTLTGFQFQPITPLQVVALQFMPSLTTAPSVSVAIYDAVTHAELTSPSDRLVSFANGTISNGFVTHRLTLPIALTAYHPYVIVALAASTDQYLTTANVAPSQQIQVMASASTPNAVSFAYPTTFGLAADAQWFCGFQTQLLNEINVNVFDVDLTTGGFSRFPAGYCRGLNIFSSDGKTILLEQGACLSAEDAANIILPVPLSILAQNGINGLDTGSFQPNYWYHVYVIGSSTLGLPTAGLLSLNPGNPTLMPLGYDVYRRVGAVLWNLGNFFTPIQQSGDGASRTTFFFTAQNLFTTILGPSGYTPVQLNWAPVTAVAVDMGITSMTVGNTNFPNAGTVDAFVRVRPSGASGEGVWTLSLQDGAIFSDHILVAPNENFLPLQVDVRVFAGTSGFIPNSPGDPNIGQQQTTFSVISYTENL